MDDERFLMDLTLLDGAPCKDFCKDILDGTLSVDISYDHYVYLTLILLKYLKQNP